MPLVIVTPVYSGLHRDVAIVCPRPPLSKKLFPVSRVGKKTPVGRSRIFFFYKLKCTGGEVNFVVVENTKKKVPIGPF